MGACHFWAGALIPEGPPEVTEPTPATPEQSATPQTQSETPEQSEATVPAPRAESEATVPTDGKTADPWSREAETVPVTAETPVAVPADALPTAAFQGAPATEGFVDAPVAKPRRRRTTLVLAIVAVVVVLLGAGAYAGARYWTGAGITEPESAVPASVVLFARIDVNPGSATSSTSRASSRSSRHTGSPRPTS